MSPATPVKAHKRIARCLIRAPARKQGNVTTTGPTTYDGAQVRFQQHQAAQQTNDDQQRQQAPRELRNLILLFWSDRQPHR